MFLSHSSLRFDKGDTCVSTCAKHLRPTAQSLEICHAVRAVVRRRPKNRANNLNVFVLAGKILHELATSTLRSGTILKIDFRNVVGALVVVLNCGPHVFIGGRLCIKGERVVVTASHLEVPCAVERLNVLSCFASGRTT